MKSFILCVHSALLCGAAVPVIAAAPCAALSTFKLPGHAVKILRAHEVPAGPLPPVPNTPPGPPVTMPAHCQVDGMLDERAGRNGKPYGIGFSLALPPNWNGRFFFQGGGGLNGTIIPPAGAQFAGETPALEQGFAIVSTDSGHHGAVFDASFLEDQQATLNFLYEANAKVTVVAKALIAKHYGRSAHHSYFVGCSTGGREAMIMSQRFPDYFDGIVAGAPTMRTSYSNLGLRWITSALNQIAPKDAQGRPQTRLAFSDSDRKLVVDGLLSACDALDGTNDGLVFATQSCRFDPQVLACSGAKTESCLSGDQIGALRKIIAGPKASDGRQVYPGYFYDTGITATRGLPGILVAPVIPEGGPANASIDVDAEAVRAHDGRSMAGDSNAWTNLSSFRARGGKLIFFHGVSDPWLSAQDTVQYYERLPADNTPDPVGTWSRLFLIPGMGHCGGGERTLDRFNMVDAIVNWVENSKAPDKIIASGASVPGQARPLCPYPAHAQYDSGDAKDAASYSCKQ